jgi:hypothetical protein
MFRKLDLFPSLSKGETPTPLGPFEGANLNHFLRDPAEKVSAPLTGGRKWNHFPKRCVF